MRRHLFNILLISSVLVGLTTLGLWTRSLFSTDLLYFTLGPAFCEFCSQDSTLYIQINTDCRPYSQWPKISSDTPGFTNPPSTFNWRTLGFGSQSGITNYVGMPPGLHYRFVRIPDWIVVLFAGVMPVIWFIRRRSTFAPGHCQKCGYDLRASKERCPECGAAIPESQRTATTA